MWYLRRRVDVFVVMEALRWWVALSAIDTESCGGKANELFYLFLFIIVLGHPFHSFKSHACHGKAHHGAIHLAVGCPQPFSSPAF